MIGPQVSTRASVVTRRTYNRPLNKEGTTFETWVETIDRVIGHQAWLWERAKGHPLNPWEKDELAELRQLMLDRKSSSAGRTLWLGGTKVAQTREASQFNCSFTHVETVYDVVDSIWLLLQGCGVGFRPIVGQLTGFVAPIKDVEIVRSTRTKEEFEAGERGREGNLETWDADSSTWMISIGDSAEAWAKSFGKLMAGKYPAKKLIIDFSEIRAGGIRLSGYGWISSGDESIAKAFEAIIAIMNRRADTRLTRIDILDLMNWLGTILSSRRSAEIALLPWGESEWLEFATAKKDYFTTGNPQRAQSNNSILFNQKPTRDDLTGIFEMMLDAGGSEPGFINGVSALQRAPWFKGVNPCAEILLGNKSFCNLFETDIGKFRGDTAGLKRAIHLVSRANYRQTCVDLRDGVLQEAWHLNNAHLRLLGVSLTGIVRRPDMTGYDFRELERVATAAGYSMADELGLPRPKNITTVKPSGTVSKIMDTPEGVHKPLGKYIFNNIVFSKHDPLVARLAEANYRMMEHPFDSSSMLITFPVKWDDVPFEKEQNAQGEWIEVNLESAVTQLERYKMLMNSWCQQNVSATISYDPEEVPEIVAWLYENWDDYVGVSFLLRADPTKTAADLGYAYLPQEVVTKETYEEYASTLAPVDVEEVEASWAELEDDECAGGMCPVK